MIESKIPSDAAIGKAQLSVEVSTDFYGGEELFIVMSLRTGNTYSGVFAVLETRTPLVFMCRVFQVEVVKALLVITGLSPPTPFPNPPPCCWLTSGLSEWPDLGAKKY